jgi:3-methyladenine DNA glycosylase/8-oxoguanine DNA glycosylase
VPTSAVSVRTFRLPQPLDVRATLGALANGRRDWCLRRAADGVWRATNSPAGAVTLHVDDRHADAFDGGGSLRVQAWGPGADWALHHADELLGLHDEPATFQPDGPLADAHRRHPGLRFCRSLALTEALVPTILGQKVQSVAAHRSWQGLVRAYGEPAPGPAAGLRLPPTARRLTELGYEAFHRFNIERRRADTIRRVCARAAGIDRLAELPAAEAQRVLETLPGLGPWTASSACQVALGAADAVVVGDYRLPHSVSWALAGEPRATDERMLELLAPYAGHRARAQRLIVRTGPPAPRYGPRLSIMTFSDR